MLLIEVVDDDQFTFLVFLSFKYMLLYESMKLWYCLITSQPMPGEVNRLLDVVQSELLGISEVQQDECGLVCNAQLRCRVCDSRHLRDLTVLSVVRGR